MTKPVTGLTQWGATTTGSTGDLDDNFTAITTAVNDLNTYSNYFADSGAADDYVVTLAANLTATLVAGLKISVRIANTNTGISTLNFNATGALPIRLPNNSTLGIGVGVLQAGGVYDFILNSDASAWILQTPFAMGGVLIAAMNANNSATIDFNNSLSNTYEVYRLVIAEARLETDNSVLSVRVGNGNASAGGYQGADYTWAATETNAGGTVIAQGAAANSATTAIRVAANVGNATNETFGGDILVTRRQGSTRYAPMTSRLAYANTAANAVTYSSGGFWTGGTAITGIQVFPNSGNIVLGRFYLYGMPSV